MLYLHIYFLDNSQIYVYITQNISINSIFYYIHLINFQYLVKMSMTDELLID